MNRRLTITLGLVLLATVSVSAQVTWTGHYDIIPNPEPSYLPTAAHPLGVSPGGSLPTLLPNAATLPPLPPPNLGGVACDQRNAWIYTCDGFRIAMDMNPVYLPFGFTAPPPLVGFLPIPAGVGPVSGLGFDDPNQILWACDPAYNFWGMNPLPPFNVIVPPQPMPVPINSPTSGIGYDPCDNTLWACNQQGGIYHFTPGGLPIGFQPVNTVPTLSLIGGLTVATHNGAGAIPPPTCSTQIPGYHVTVTDGTALHDALGLAPPIPQSGGPIGLAFGLGYSSDYQELQCFQAGTVGLPCSSGLVPFTGTREPLITGPALFNGLNLVNAPPSTPGFLLIDFCPQLPCWNGLMMNPFSWTSVPIVTTAAGTHAIGFFAGGFPKGFQFSHQYAIQDVSAPLGYCFSNVSTQTVSAP
jgi:hypothetical protein